MKDQTMKNSVYAPRPQRARIFKSDLMEKLTLVRWYHPFMVWLPFIAYLYYWNLTAYPMSGFKIFALTLLGVLLWTLAEYCIHRFIFHIVSDVKWLNDMVYTIHGNHHEDPHDPLRGVMPIFPATVYITILYIVFWLIFPIEFLGVMYGSFLLGYLAYDGLHYYTHHGKPKNKFLKFLRRSHLVHHVHDDIVFGISTPLWDIIFGTYRKQGQKIPNNLDS